MAEDACVYTDKLFKSLNHFFLLQTISSHTQKKKGKKKSMLNRGRWAVFWPGNQFLPLAQRPIEQ